MVTARQKAVLARISEIQIRPVQRRIKADGRIGYMLDGQDVRETVISLIVAGLVIQNDDGTIRPV